VEAGARCGEIPGHRQLKFADRNRPNQIEKATFRDVKAKVMDLRQERRRIQRYAILHAIASGQEKQRARQFGANTMLGNFNEFLGTDRDTYGRACSIETDRQPLPVPEG